MTEASWHVHVDRRLCEGHALCVELAPDVFEVGSDDVASCVEMPADSLREQVIAAAAACPRQAIDVVTRPR